MRIGHLQPTRPEWWDRNPTSALQGQNYPAATPGFAGVFWTYTVPTGKKAWLAAINALITVVTSPTAGGESSVEVYVFDGSAQASLAFVPLRATQPGAGGSQGLAVGWMMPAGVQLSGQYACSNTGGTQRVGIHALITQFDA